MNILVIKLSAFGDFLLALSSMAAIRQHHADAKITLLTTRPFVDMAERSRYFDEILVSDRPKWYELGKWVDLFHKMNRGHFDRVYDLQMNNRMRRYYHLFMRKPAWSGVIKGSPLFYDNPDWRSMHADDRHREVLKVAGITVGKADLSWMTADVSLLGLKKPYVLLIPGSAPTRPDKRWPAIRYGALGLKLMRYGFNVGVLGTNAEKEVIDRVIKSGPGIVNLMGKTSFYDMAELARGAVAAVGNDTGPTHLLALAGCKTVAIFGASSDPLQSAPVGDVQIIHTDDMNAVSVDAVIKALAPALGL